MTRLAVFLAAVLFMGGCGVRLTDEQAAQLGQAAANMAAADAVEKAAPAAPDPAAHERAAAVLREAALARVSAAIANLDGLPEPEKPAAVLAPAGIPDQAKVAKEAEDAKAAKGDPPSGMLGMILGGVGGVGLLALSVLRFSPGAFGLVANLAHGILAPQATRDMRQAQAKAMDIARTAVEYGQAVTATAVAHGLGDKVEAVKAQAAQIQDRLGIRDQVASILAQAKAGSAIRPAIPPPT